MKKYISLLSLISIIIAFHSCQQSDTGLTFTDKRDGSTYEYVQIGNQYWMSENLQFKPDNGIYWAYDDDEARADDAGYLYDFDRACELCPDGWHLATRAEWDTLLTYLGGVEMAGMKMKYADSSRWKATIPEGTNSSGFSALPEGVRRYDGRYSYYNRYAYFWSSSDGREEGEAWCFALDGPQPRIHPISWDKDNALSVRCVKD